MIKDFTIAFSTWVIVLVACIATWAAIIIGLIFLIKEVV